MITVISGLWIDEALVDNTFRLKKSVHYEYLGPKKYRTLCEIRLQVFDDVKKGQFVVVPKNFFFDGASIPKFIRWLIEDEIEDPLIFFASLIHDYLYDKKDHRGKLFADRLFKAVMVWQGMLVEKAQLRWTGVSGVVSWVVWVT